MEMINDVVNSLIEYLNIALEYVGLKVIGSFDYNLIIDAIMGLFGDMDLGSLLGG